VDGTESLPNIYNTPNAAPKAAAAANAGGGARGAVRTPLNARTPPAPGAAAAEAREAYMRGAGSAQPYDYQAPREGYDEPPPEPPSFLSRLRRKK